MTLFKNKYRIESIRLKNWDYSTGAYYYITINLDIRRPLFGIIKDSEAVLSREGEIVGDTLENLHKYHKIELLDSVIMPDHIHFVVHKIGGKDKTLSDVIKGFKTFTTKKIGEIKGTGTVKIWQKGFYERIIRNEREYSRIAEYIRNNPVAEDDGELVFD